MNNTLEVRTTTATCLRAAKSKDFVIEGTAASYNVLSNDLGGFKERIQPGAFDLSLSDPQTDCKCLLQHSPDKILGRQKNGTLKVWSDARGLQFSCQLDPTNSMHKDAYASIKRGDLSECSFAFTVPQDGDLWDFSATPITRTLRNVNLMDVSAVTYPAYSADAATQVSARAATMAASRGKQYVTPTKDQLHDDLNRQACKVWGQVIEIDKRQLQADEISSRRGALVACLASKGTGWTYLCHDEQYVYGVPTNAVEPDDSDSDIAWKCARWNYELDNNGEVILSNCQTRWNYELDPQGHMVMKNAAPVFAELRLAGDTRRKMRTAAGIFY